MTTPTGFRDAYRDYAAGGWIGLAGDPAYGGQGLPYVLAAAMNEFVTSANMAFGMYPGLTQGAIAALTLHGSDEQKRTYLPKLMSGEWAGTMNLTEPQAGTDLGLLRTRATPECRRQLRHHRHQDLHLLAASTTSPRTSSTSSSPGSTARRREPRASRSSSCRSCSPTAGRRGRRAERRRLRLARDTRWASTATPPAS